MNRRSFFAAVAGIVAPLFSGRRRAYKIMKPRVEIVEDPFSSHSLGWFLHSDGTWERFTIERCLKLRPDKIPLLRKMGYIT